MLCSAALILALLPAARMLDDPQAKPEIPEATLSEAKLGEYWYGAPLDLRDLAGKVVLWETWGS